ncbi:Flp family type IVb pilin [Devosia chinhatensis]|uniref:Pilus assembly protein n=1 Tax=Devosia chinhatensis TaxID=429727 RepID=A0A0F5FFP8_9HYPH|nr:Flp family type IVb pilin [Devosia chinhatensis]KKB07603.1 hypothetical protein VE26_12905 [Devosia chinhatensis]
MLAQSFRRFFSDQTGATAIEYALLGTLIAVALVASFTLFGDAVANMFGTGPGGAGQVIASQTDKIE